MCPRLPGNSGLEGLLASAHLCNEASIKRHTAAAGTAAGMVQAAKGEKGDKIAGSGLPPPGRYRQGRGPTSRHHCVQSCRASQPLHVLAPFYHTHPVHRSMPPSQHSPWLFLTFHFPVHSPGLWLSLSRNSFFLSLPSPHLSVLSVLETVWTFSVCLHGRSSPGISPGLPLSLQDLSPFLPCGTRHCLGQACLLLCTRAGSHSPAALLLQSHPCFCCTVAK